MLPTLGRLAARYASTDPAETTNETLEEIADNVLDP